MERLSLLVSYSKRAFIPFLVKSCVLSFQGHTDELWGLASHPFKDLFLTCAQDRQVCMWNSVDHTLEWTRLLDVCNPLVLNRKLKNRRKKLVSATPLLHLIARGAKILSLWL